MPAWANHLRKNIRYPKEAQRKKQQGRVYVRFIVATDGGVKNVEVLKGTYPSLDEEAMRVVKMSPRWTPGSIDGQVVEIPMILPIVFKM